MLSEEMYYLIKQAPRDGNGVFYNSLKVLNEANKYELVCEALHSDYEYLYKRTLSSAALEKSAFSLTEKGQAAIEAYEQDKRSQETVAKSLRVSRIAMWAAIASAGAAFFSLIKMFLP